jgi:hypothetical protein
MEPINMTTAWTRQATKNATRIGAIGVMGLLVAFAGSATAASNNASASMNEPGAVATADTIRATPQAIWDAARNGDSATLDTLLSPQAWNDSDINKTLLTSIERLKTNIAKRETTRTEQITDANDRLLEHLDLFDENNSGIELSKALAAAVELQMLFNDDDRFFSDASVARAIHISDETAIAAELSGDWMIASELYYRLNAIFDPSGIYKEQVNRLSRRLAMIRMYAPERLWEIRNQRRIDEELEPLPPYNAYGDDFHEKLNGINSITVRTAIQRAADQHVGRKTRKHPTGVTMNDLILSGLSSIETMATTTDLAIVFDGLANESQRSQLLEVIKTQKNKIKAKEHTASGYDLRRSLDAVLAAGQKNTGILETALLHEFGNGAMAALDDYTAIIWPDELARFR